MFITVAECAFCGKACLDAGHVLRQYIPVVNERRIILHAEIQLSEKWCMLDSGEVYCPECSERFGLYASPKVYGVCKRCGEPLLMADKRHLCYVC